MKYQRIKPSSNNRLKKWINALVAFFVATLGVCYMLTEKEIYMLGLLLMCGSAATYLCYRSMPAVKEKRNIIKKIRSHIDENELYIGTYDGKKMRYDYYPKAYMKIDEVQNILYVKFRLTGNKINLRDMEDKFKDRLMKTIIGVFETKGYIEYRFELNEEHQVIIESRADIQGEFGEKEVVFSRSFVWNYLKTPHFAIIGTTNSGKSQCASFIMENLTKQGARIVYIDIKRDQDMEKYCQFNNMISYASELEDILVKINEVKHELDTRKKIVSQIDVGENFTFDFEPLFLVCDELILLKMKLPSKEYKEIMDVINEIIVSGRNRAIYCGLISQSGLAEYFGNSAFRGNVGLKISMGQMSDTELSMIFGKEFDNVKNLRYDEIGSGLIMRHFVDQRPREFMVPFIKKDALTK